MLADLLVLGIEPPLGIGTTNGVGVMGDSSRLEAFDVCYFGHHGLSFRLEN